MQHCVQQRQNYIEKEGSNKRMKNVFPNYSKGSKKKKNPCDRAFMKLMLPRGLEMIESVALDWVYFLYHLNIKWHKEIWIAAHISREISNSSDRSSSRGKRVTGGKETYMSGDSGNQKNPVSSLCLEVLKPLKGFLPFPLFRVLQF